MTSYRPGIIKPNRTKPNLSQVVKKEDFLQRIRSRGATNTSPVASPPEAGQKRRSGPPQGSPGRIVGPTEKSRARRHAIQTSIRSADNGGGEGERDTAQRLPLAGRRAMLRGRGGNVSPENFGASCAARPRRRAPPPPPVPRGPPPPPPPD